MLRAILPLSRKRIQLRLLQMMFKTCIKTSTSRQLTETLQEEITSQPLKRQTQLYKRLRLILQMLATLLQLILKSKKPCWTSLFRKRTAKQMKKAVMTTKPLSMSNNSSKKRKGRKRQLQMSIVRRLQRISTRSRLNFFRSNRRSRLQMQKRTIKIRH